MLTLTASLPNRESMSIGEAVACTGISQRAILHALRETTRGKTVMVISHRLSAVRDADLIVVLDEGRIVETGTHTSLVERGGVYAELFQQQTLEEELAEL